MFDPVVFREDGAGGARSRSGRRSSGFFSLAPASFTLSAQTKWRLVVSTPLAGGGKVGGAVTFVKGGGGGDGDRDFPDSAVSVLLRSCDWGPASSADDGVTSEMMPTL